MHSLNGVQNMKRFVAVKAERYTTSKQCLRIYKDHFALQNACWEIPNPWTASDGCRLRVFAKRSFSTPQECAAITEIVMITGIGIASQQANEPSRILILRANLAFVRTKALLATVMVLRMRLRNFSFALQTGWHFCIIGSMNTRIKSEGLSD